MGTDAAARQNNPFFWKSFAIKRHIQAIRGNKRRPGCVFIYVHREQSGGMTRMAGSSFFGMSQRRAFRKLVGNSRDRLYRMAYAWTHSPHLADDLVQQTMLKALNNQRQLQNMAAAEAWLFRILSNCLKDHHRAKREVLSSEEIELHDNHTPEREASQQQLVDTVRQAVQSLPLAQRQVVTLVDLEGFTYASVAEILEIPVGTVMSRLCRGRRALRDLLTEIRPQTDERRIGKLKRVK
jgi:RNA polymerase sigma-70 factor (ECF subfamily)